MRSTRSTIASVYSASSSSLAAKRERRHTSSVSGCFLLIVFHVKEVVGGVDEREGRANLCKHHFLLTQFHFGNGLAAMIAARYFAVAVRNGVAQHFGGDVEYHVGQWQRRLTTPKLEFQLMQRKKTILMPAMYTQP